jgi:hypothetical protein
MKPTTTTSTAALMATDATTNSNTQAPAEQAAPLSPRARIARLILVYHFALIGVSCVLYILKGFDFEEFTSLMGVLAPVTALYGGAVFRFLGRSITEPSLQQNGAPVNSLVKLARQRPFRHRAVAHQPQSTGRPTSSISRT